MTYQDYLERRWAAMANHHGPHTSTHKYIRLLIDLLNPKKLVRKKFKVCG